MEDTNPPAQALIETAPPPTFHSLDLATRVEVGVAWSHFIRGVLHASELIDRRRAARQTAQQAQTEPTHEEMPVSV